jgi:hypothetical protein
MEPNALGSASSGARSQQRAEREEFTDFERIPIVVSGRSAQ